MSSPSPLIQLDSFHHLFPHINHQSRATWGNHTAPTSGGQWGLTFHCAAEQEDEHWGASEDCWWIAKLSLLDLNVSPALFPLQTVILVQIWAMWVTHTPYQMASFLSHILQKSQDCGLHCVFKWNALLADKGHVQNCLGSAFLLREFVLGFIQKYSSFPVPMLYREKTRVSWMKDTDSS